MLQVSSDSALPAVLMPVAFGNVPASLIHAYELVFAASSSFVDAGLQVTMASDPEPHVPYPDELPFTSRCAALHTHHPTGHTAGASSHVVAILLREILILGVTVLLAHS
jgi:hypothetical protein